MVSAREAWKAWNESRFVIAIFDKGELVAEVCIDGPTLETDEDISEMLIMAGRSYEFAPSFPATKKPGPHG